jgi:hypothetical protein
MHWAAPFGATVVIALHPGLNGTGRPMGSSLYTSLADFCVTAKHKDGVVSTDVDKMKNGPDGFTVKRQPRPLATTPRSEPWPWAGRPPAAPLGPYALGTLLNN